MNTCEVVAVDIDACTIRLRADDEETCKTIAKSFGKVVSIVPEKARIVEVELPAASVLEKAERDKWESMVMDWRHAWEESERIGEQVMTTGLDECERLRMQVLAMSETWVSKLAYERICNLSIQLNRLQSEHDATVKDLTTARERIAELEAEQLQMTSERNLDIQLATKQAVERAEKAEAELTQLRSTPAAKAVPEVTYSRSGPYGAIWVGGEYCVAEVKDDGVSEHDRFANITKRFGDAIAKLWPTPTPALDREKCDGRGCNLEVRHRYCDDCRPSPVLDAIDSFLGAFEAAPNEEGKS